MRKHVAMALGVTLAFVLGVSTAQAQTVRRETVTTGPNSAMLSSGVFVFGVPYIASIVVAANSDRSEDKHLYVPVVGPWLDFANRSPCGGFAQHSCDNETVNKVLLVADGIFQGIGALEIVGAFMSPETRTVRVATEPRVTVGPSRVGAAGYGVAAAGTF